MSRARWIALALLCGCGRLDFDPITADAPAACRFGAWSAPVVDTELSSPDTEVGPALTADGLEVFFHSDRPGSIGGLDLFHAVRASTSEPFGTPTPVANVNSSAEDGGAALMPDGLTLYLDSTRGGPTQIYRTTRPDRASPFATPVRVDALLDIFGATISSDGTEMFATRPGGAGDIYRITNFESSTPVFESVDALNTLDTESYPSISGDGLTLYYVEISDLARATRSAIGAPFVPDGVQTDLSSPDYDDDPEISRDGTMFLQASSRSSPNIDIYVATRACP